MFVGLALRARGLGSRIPPGMLKLLSSTTDGYDIQVLALDRVEAKVALAELRVVE
jgi:hypothetical protein